MGVLSFLDLMPIMSTFDTVLPLSPCMPGALAPAPSNDALSAGLDLSHFPLVRMRRGGAPGYSFAWAATLRGLIARGKPFILLDSDATDGQGESEDDRRARRGWMRTHAAALSRCCYGWIAVQRDVEARSGTRAQALSLIGSEALRVIVVSSEAVACQLADVLLKTGKRSATGTVARCVGRAVVPGPVDIGAKHANPVRGRERDR